MSAASGYVVIMFFFGLAGGIVGRVKGSSFFIWFLISAAGPVPRAAAAIFYRYDNQELRRQCPGCGRVVKLHDAVCTRCGDELEFPDVAIASEARCAQRAACHRAETALLDSPVLRGARGIVLRATQQFRAVEGGEAPCVQSTP